MRDNADASLIQIVPSRYGRMMVLSNDRYMGKAFLAWGEYSESEVDLWRQLLPPDAIVADIGANIGAHTIALASLVPNGAVIAFEPLPFLYAMMVGNIALNALTHVIPKHAAVGAETGRLTVPAIDYTRDDNYGGLCLMDHAQGNSVPLVRLDDVMPICHFLKIDVEGMERYVLHGAERILRECRPALYVENNPGPQQQALIDQIHGYGYDLWWHYAPHFNADNFAGNPEVDAHMREVVSYNMLGLPSEGQHEIGGLLPIPKPPGGVSDSETTP
jgi:FkbM family methyltransferase